MDEFIATLIDSSEYPDSAVDVTGASGLSRFPELIGRLDGWCEEIEITACRSRETVDLIGRVTSLKSLTIVVSVLDDEGLLSLSKLRNLCKLKIQGHTGDATSAGWLQLARLSQLEYLELPLGMLRDRGRVEQIELKQEIQRRMPQTIVK